MHVSTWGPDPAAVTRDCCHQAGRWPLPGGGSPLHCPQAVLHVHAPGRPAQRCPGKSRSLGPFSLRGAGTELGLGSAVLVREQAGQTVSLVSQHRLLKVSAGRSGSRACRLGLQEQGRL